MVLVDTAQKNKLLHVCLHAALTQLGRVGPWSDLKQLSEQKRFMGCANFDQDFIQIVYCGMKSTFLPTF